jgi:LPS-assembly protein
VRAQDATATASTPTTQDAAIPSSDELATLLADRVSIRNQNELVAEGNVEVFYKSNRLSAKRVIYDQKADKLYLEGPIRLVQPGQSQAVILASQAELSSDLQNGILLSARMVMARELQLAAARIERRDGAITIMDKVVASSCEVCRTNPTPLWEIRASRVVHNATTRQIVFEDAQFRAAGVPIAYLPRLRLPAPGVRRMTGFLAPQFRTTSGLGPGLLVPYFIALGPSRDLTVTPYFATSRTETLNLRYRQAFNWGKMEWSGALSNDDIRSGTRGYLFGDLEAQLPREFRLTAQLRLVSDDSYLLNYGLGDDDRLWSGVELERVRRDELIWTRVGNVHSLRADESNSTEPMLSGTGEWIRTFRPAGIGGQGSLRSSTLATRRFEFDARSQRRRPPRRARHGAWLAHRRLAPQLAVRAGYAGLARGAIRGRHHRDQSGPRLQRHDPARPTHRRRGNPLALGEDERSRRLCDRASGADRLGARSSGGRPQRGQPAARIRWRQSVLADPLPGRRRARDRPARQCRARMDAL